MAVGDPGGTKLFLSRPIELFERDIIVFGESIELGVMPVADSPVLECVWEECAVRLIPIRKSKRTPIYTKEAQMDKTIIFRVPKDGEVIIGRSEDNHIHFPDVYIYNYIYYYLNSINYQIVMHVCILNH